MALPDQGLLIILSYYNRILYNLYSSGCLSHLPAVIAMKKWNWFYPHAPTNYDDLTNI
ncbi:MAG: hypothetical protein ACKO85_08080 [Isosphaeraceae bacterium]